MANAVLKSKLTFSAILRETCDVANAVLTSYWFAFGSGAHSKYRYVFTPREDEVIEVRIKSKAAKKNSRWGDQRR
jgi:hypothetical protein